METPKTPSQPKENIFVSLLFNIIIPIFILNKLTAPLGPLQALLLSLAFPLVYGLIDYIRCRRLNLVSLLSFVAASLKGAFALFHVDVFWFAVQEAALPIFFGAVMVASVWFKRPLVNYFLYNENMFNIPLLTAKLAEKQQEKAFARLIWGVTLLFGFSFFLAGVLNYILARHFIVSPVGSASFNQELAHMNAIGYGVILIPKMLISFFAVGFFIYKLKKLTGLTLAELTK